MLRYLLTLLAFVLVFLPGYINQALQPGLDLILTEKHLFSLFISRIPALILLISMVFYSARSRDFSSRPVSLKIADLKPVIILPLLTLGLGALMSAENQRVFVEIHSVSAALLLFAAALSSAVIEELYFRSWLLSELPALGWPLWLSAVFSVLLFGSGHLWAGFNAFILALISGTLYSVFFLHKRSILPLILAHTIHNTVVLGIYAFR